MIEADSVLSTPRTDSSPNTNVVQFAAFAAAAKLAKEEAAPEGGAMARYRAERKAKRDAKLAELTTAPDTLTETCKNHRLRQSRRDAWWAATRLTDYWRARLKWESALSLAQEYDIADANSFPKCDYSISNRFASVKLWREALVKQMLTPAPDVAAVNWKRTQMKAEQYRHIGVKPERLQRAIDADIEWLEAHPSRKSIATSRQAKKGTLPMTPRREFNEAMRQRIRDVAASRDLCDEEIKAALTLKHEPIWQFSQQHGVNLEWLLEGKGRIFKKDPIELSPNMTGSEFAEIVTTLPVTDQRAIEAKMRELLQRDIPDEPA